MLTWSLELLAAYADRSFLPVGGHATGDGVVYRVWAPDHAAVRVVTGGSREETRYVPLERDAEGFFAGRDERGAPGDLYWFQLGDHGAALVADPASRFQPQGVEGPSLVVDPRAFQWQTDDWQRPALRGRVIYELHVGAFTAGGTFRAAIARLDALVELGVTAIELMPVGDFAGSRNWGYDGVMLYAPAHSYGTPEDLRALVDAAHARGLAVILDVVYNHLGPIGNVLPKLSRHYFHSKPNNPWGSGLNFDGRHAEPVRQFFIQNACMWLDEFRFDGLRLDAVHAIADTSAHHIIEEIAAAAHARGALVIAEDEHNDAGIITPVSEGGWGVDGMWADDFHHSVRVGLTRERHAYYMNYTGGIDEWVETLRRGWVYRGQEYASWQRPRGTEAGHLPPEQFVYCISNHDQVGNRPTGDRLHHIVSPEAYRAVSMLLCFVPYTPMLFMGQEWTASSPFPFFTDHPGDVGAHIRENRIKEFQHHHAHYDAASLARMPDPQSESAFRAAKLNWDEREATPHREMLALYRACLQLRVENPVFQSPARGTWTVERVSEDALGLHWRDSAGDWLLLVSPAAGAHRVSHAAFERARNGRHWQRVLASDEPRFGGAGTAAWQPGEPMLFTGPAAVLLRER